MTKLLLKVLFVLFVLALVLIFVPPLLEAGSTTFDGVTASGYVATSVFDGAEASGWVSTPEASLEGARANGWVNPTPTLPAWLKRIQPDIPAIQPTVCHVPMTCAGN